MNKVWEKIHCDICGKEVKEKSNWIWKEEGVVCEDCQENGYMKI